MNDTDARFRMLIELSSDWFWEQDENFRFTSFTWRTDCKQRFSTPDETIGKARWELPYVGVTEEQWKAHKAILNDHRPFYDLEFKRPDQDGSLRYCSISGIPIFDTGNKFKGYRGIGRDVTDQVHSRGREAIALAVSQHLAGLSTIGEAMPNILRSVCEIMEWEYGAYWRLDDAKAELRCAKVWCRPSITESEFMAFNRDCPSVDFSRENMSKNKSSGVIRRVYKHGEPVWIDDLTKHHWTGRMVTAVKAGLHSAFAFPITVDGETFGIMEFFSGEIRKRDPELLKMTYTIGSQIGQFCQRIQAEATLQETNQALQALVRTSPLAIYTYDLDGRVTLWNPAATRMFGWTETETVGRFLPLVQEEKAEEFRLLREKMKRGEWLTNLELVRRKKDGSRIDISVSTAPQADADGRVYGIMGLAADITERKHAEARRTLEHAVTRLLAQRYTLTEAIAKIIEILCQTLGWDYGAYWGFVNHDVSLHRVKSWGAPGINVDEFVKRSEYEAFKVQQNKSESPGGLIRRAWFYKQALWTEDVSQDPSFRRAPLAKTIGFRTGFAFPVVAGQEVFGVMEFFTRDRRKSDDALLQTCQSIGHQIGQYFERQYSETRQAVEHAVTRLLAESDSPAAAMPAVLKMICSTLGWHYGGYWAFDEQNAALRCVDTWSVPLQRVSEFAESCRSLALATDAADIIGRSWSEAQPVWITNVADPPGFERGTAAEKANLYTAFAFPITIGDAKIGVMEFFVGDVRQPDEVLLRSAQMIGIQIGQFCQRKQAEQNLLFVASHDALTMLPNRGMFNERLDHALARARRHDSKLSVFFIDLDRFKNINDTLGHEAGDCLLQEMARRLSACLRETDTVARQGGDEFIVMLEELSEPQHAAQIAAKILSIVATPVQLSGREYQLTASIGISTYPGDGQDSAALLKNADSAMYRAKELGKNNFQFYSAQMNLHSLERLELEARLRRAFERKEFLLYYQPKVDIRTGHINGVEALLRWQHPDRGLVPPAQFIPLAEETGLIVPIGRWVLQTACKQIQTWQEQGLPPLHVAVNLSARQFADDNLLQDIKAALTTSGLDPTHLELEITESMVMRDPDKAVKILTDLSEMGLRVAIDDFGTGYSSLSALKRFPVHDLKIDRSFIKDIPADGDNVAITQAIIALAHSLRMTVIAEGVETKEQLDFLSKNGCDDMQGYYFSKPLPEKELLAFLNENLSLPKEPEKSVSGL